MSDKGQNYEREKCKQLSLWTSGGKFDAWFWRASQSGGRATSRWKKGETTTGHCGDICSTCPESAWVTKLFTIECKKGYGDDGNPFNVIDRLVTAKHGREKTFHAFVIQAEAAMHRADSAYWMLIYRRPQKRDMIYLPIAFWFQSKSKITNFTPAVRLDFWNGKDEMSVGGVLFDDFLKFFTPHSLKRLLRA
jgi:hypothetical protein